MSIKESLIFVIAIALLWVIGLVAYVGYMPMETRYPNKKTDAIVVLTGGQGRIAEGFALYMKGYAKHLFISGVEKDSSLDDIKRMNKITLPDDREHSTHLGLQAKSTFGNADETRDWIENFNVKSIRLVTSAYHMPRSMVIFQRTLPSLEMIAHPVVHEDFSYERWWLNETALIKIISEYHKFIAFVILHPFGVTW